MFRIVVIPKTRKSEMTGPKMKAIKEKPMAEMDRLELLPFLFRNMFRCRFICYTPFLIIGKLYPNNSL